MGGEDPLAELDDGDEERPKIFEPVDSGDVDELGLGLVDWAPLPDVELTPVPEVDWTPLPEVDWTPLPEIEFTPLEWPDDRDDGDDEPAAPRPAA